ncbi:PLP-dependent aminotransferase family protein [Kiloniella majae]|uniref:aminotransferase-like domain-containing protein n=1 Tax=Kiloniella majae TaxID=1938558 RepID=UPI000A279638|nr:PLP-dependent aminotransferase family protein [Kiloniella majae]
MDWEKVFATRSSRMKASEIRELLKLLDQPDIISFAGGIPDPALFPTEEFQQAFTNTLTGDKQTTALQYSVSEGYVPLRQWIAKQMEGLGIPCSIDNILITSGSQQALDYLGKLLLSPNDTALVTWPTYMGALGAFNAYEPHYDRLIANGNRSAKEYQEAAAEKNSEVKFAYMSVDFANPTGETLDRPGREKLLDLAEELDIPVIEDAAYQSLRYDGEAIPPILALDIQRKGHIDETRTLYCGSFSKTLAPGLRVGWVCAAQSVISKLVLMKQAADLHSSTINQIAIHEVASKGFDKQVAKIFTAYSTRRDCMLAALEEHMPEGVSWTKPEGGMFIWLTLPKHLDGAELLAKSIETQRVAFVPGHAFYADGSNRNTMRLSFSQANEETINEGIGRLGLLLKSV